MLKTLALLIGSVCFFISCGKSNTGCQPVAITTEYPQMVGYCVTNGITYTQDSSGLLYQIIIPGSGVAPVSSSTVSVLYTAKFFSGVTFDSSTNASAPFVSPLSNLIDGWKIGLPLIKKGGRIKLVIPSALAYSCIGAVTNGVTYVAPNTPLFFDITLIDVQ